MNMQVQSKATFWGLSKKISATLIFLSVVGVLLSSITAFILIEGKSDSALRQELSLKSFQAVQNLETLFAGFESDLHLMASSPATEQALFSFIRAWEIYVGVAQKDLPELYGATNPHPIDQRDKLDFAAQDTSAYGQVHLKHHGWFREFIQTKGYEDLMLIDRQGNVIYSVKKQDDFANNVSLGDLRDSVLGDLFRKMQSSQVNEQAFSDYAIYEAAGGQAVAFLGEPVRVDGEIMGLMVLRLPLDKINEVLVKTADFQGEGEVILIGEDRLTRNQSPFSDQSTVMKRRLTNAFVRSALEGAIGVVQDQLEDKERYIGYAPYQFKDSKFAVLLVKAPAEGKTEFQYLLTQFGGTVGVILLLVIALAVLASARISKNLRKLTTLVDQIAQGRHPGSEILSRTDELGQIANALLEMNEIGVENTRVRAALDTATTCIMMADSDRNIIYINNAVYDMLSNAQSEIQKALPHFNVDTILGQSIDRFHKNPNAQAEILENLEGVHKTRMHLGAKIFDLTAASVFDEYDQRIGSVVVWDDLSEKLSAEAKEKEINLENQQIRTALDRCAANLIVADENRQVVFVNRAMLDLFDRFKSDFDAPEDGLGVKRLCQMHLEEIHPIIHQELENLIELKQAKTIHFKIGACSFDCVISPIHDEEGRRVGTVMEWYDKTNERIVQNEVDEVVKAVVKGDFHQNIRLDNKEGFMLGLAQSINQLKDQMNDVFNEIANSMSAMNQGDLSYMIEKDYHGRFESIKTDINATSNRLSLTVSDILVASREITAASSEIASGSNDLSKRTENQASSLQETAASMEEISTTVNENAKNALNAEHLAQDACQVAIDGGGVINEAVEAMSSIKSSSQKVSDIIGVIDEIAFQTNLLALNAAVEAARAGEAGKGFGVVASEVRILAQRSSEAAKDIKSLILDSNQQVNEGVELVSNMGGSFHEIVNSIQRVADIVSEIAASSQEQATGVSEINSAITQMDELTQQNAALVEESSASAKSLADQSEKMVHLMAFFKNQQSKQASDETPPHSDPLTSGGEPPRLVTPAPTVKVKKMETDTSNTGGEDAGWEEF